MRRLLSKVVLVLVALVALQSQVQFEEHQPWQIPVDSWNGQVPGAGFAGDSTICDTRGCEGNFFRAKSHLDFFDLTTWGPDPELGVAANQPLPPHTLEIRDSSNNVIMRYQSGTWTFYGKVETR